MCHFIPDSNIYRWNKRGMKFCARVILLEAEGSISSSLALVQHPSEFSSSFSTISSFLFTPPPSFGRSFWPLSPLLPFASSEFNIMPNITENPYNANNSNLWRCTRAEIIWPMCCCHLAPSPGLLFHSGQKCSRLCWRNQIFARILIAGNSNEFIAELK